MWMIWRRRRGLVIGVIIGEDKKEFTKSRGKVYTVNKYRT